MSHSNIEIKEGAFFISDAHYSYLRPELLSFFKAIKNKTLLPTQIFLMGDIFDALFGGIDKTLQNNQELISIINELSLTLEIIYLEGNHDFNLKHIFKNINVFTIGQQPVSCTFKNQNVILAHGDFDGKVGYKIYTFLIRNRIILKLLNNFDAYILNKLDGLLSKKDDCMELSWFESFIKKRINSTYNCKYFVEGHFHQNKRYQLDEIKYINLGAFACNQRYFIVKSSKDNELLEENIFSKET